MAETATNPKTGERLVLLDGQWKPFTKSATGPSGEKAYLVGNSWFQDIKKEGNVIKPPPTFVPSGEKLPSDAETVAAQPLTRFAVGAAKPILGLAQRGENIVTGGSGGPITDTLNQYRDIETKGRDYYGSKGFDWWGGAGQALSPVYLKAGALMPATKTAWGRIAQGTGMGAFAGASEPVYGEGNQIPRVLGNTFGGALIGGSIPTAWELAKLGGRGIRNIFQPSLGEWGSDRAAGRLLNEVAGQKAPQIIQNLENPQTIVPGASPTAGQAAVPAGSSEFSALQNIVAQKDPSKYGVAGIEGAQQGARLQAVRDVGQTPADINNAEFLRDAAAKVNYRAAGREQISINKTPFETLLQRPSMDKAISTAQTLAAEKGIPFSLEKDVFGQLKPLSVQHLQMVKMALDDMTKNPERFGLGASEQASIGNTKKAFTSWLERESPAWAYARDTFAHQSRPINQMQIGQYLEGKLTPPLEAGERATAYTQALRDALGTIKRSTGQQRYQELTDILTPRQTKSVMAVGEDLKRNALLKALSSEGMTAAKEKIGGSIPEAPSPGYFNMLVSAGRAGYNRLAGKATNKILDDVAKNWHDPQKIAQMMKDAKPSERQALVDALMKYQAVLPAAASQEIQ